MTKSTSFPAVTLCGVSMVLAAGIPREAWSGPRGQGGQTEQRPSSDSKAQDAGNADLAKRLAGTWKAPEYRMERTGALDVEVFGVHASDVRNVDLTLQPSGEGVLKVSTSVVDRNGRKWAPSLLEAKLRVGPPAAAASGGRIQPTVTVLSAEMRYLDGAGDRYPRDGSRVTITTDSTLAELDLRLDTAMGDGSFWTTLKRQRAPQATASRPSRATAKGKT
jgi:hypothetical protein